jgi:hypothetical protein
MNESQLLGGETIERDRERGIGRKRFIKGAGEWLEGQLMGSTKHSGDCDVSVFVCTVSQNIPFELIHSHFVAFGEEYVRACE